MKDNQFPNQKLGRRLLSLATISVVTVLGFSLKTFAAEEGCGGLLSSDDYIEGNQLVLEPKLTVFSRKAEFESLEFRKPGIGKSIIQVMYGRMPYFRWAHARPLTDKDAFELYEVFQKIISDLEEIPNKFNLEELDRDRFSAMREIIEEYIHDSMRAYNSFSRTSEKISSFTTLLTMIQSALLELLISTLIDGKKFWFHHDALEFYKGPRQTPSGKVKKHKGDHEIDIIVGRNDGRYLWVEVKNNAIGWSLSDYAEWLGTVSSQLPSNILDFHGSHERSRTFLMNGKMLDQMKAQSELKRQLSRDHLIKIILVSKNPIPTTLHEQLNRLGIQSWPIHLSARPFYPLLFQEIASQLGILPEIPQ